MKEYDHMQIHVMNMSVLVIGWLFDSALPLRRLKAHLGEIYPLLILK